MRMTKYAMAAALAAITWGHSAFGQQPNYSGQSANGAPVTNARPVSYDYYSTQDSQQNVAYSLASSSAMAGGGETCGAAPACSTGCGDQCCSRDPLLCWPCGCTLADMGEPKKWFDGCFFKCNDITAGGWLAQSYTWNPYVPNDRFNGPVTWTDRANEYQMNELYFFLGKAAKTDGCGFDYGYRTDILYGTNYRWDTSAGFETNFGNGSFYGLAIPAAYGEVAYNDLTVKAGRFISPVGFYTVGTAANFFPVIPYTYQYGEPFTHTGVLATYKASDNLTFGGGVTHGWDNTDNTGNPYGGALATATWTIDDTRSLAWVGVYGKEPNASGIDPAANGIGYTTRYFQTLVYTKKFNDDIMGVLQSDYGVQGDAIGPNQAARWYGVNAYLYWNMTCQTQWGLNGEWFRDEGGFRVGTVLPSLGSPNARGLARAGYDGSFYRLTFGPKHYFTPNLYARAAFLFDWYDGKVSRFDGSRPFDDGTKTHQQLGVFDLVYTF